MRLIYLALTLLISCYSHALTYTFGKYTGNADASQAISGVGFQAEALLVRADHSSHPSWLALQAMGGTKAKKFETTGKLSTDVFDGFSADGFTVKGDANADGVDYYFVAFDDDADLVQSSYTGDGSTHSESVGFRPALTFLAPDHAGGTDNTRMQFAFDSSNGNEWRADGSKNTQDLIGTDAATSFTTGANAEVTDSVYYYMSIAASSDLIQGSFTAPGDNRNYTSPGIQSDVIIVQPDGYLDAVIKTSDMDSTDSFSFAPSVSYTNGIRSITSTGYYCAGNTDYCNGWQTMHFAAFKGGMTLPVELAYQKAFKQGANEVKIEWETLSEINTSHFTVQRSTDGIIFEDLATIQAAGQSMEPITYEYIDPMPNDGLNYYRIHQVDLDGLSEMFNIMVVDMNTGAELTQVKAYPNPVFDEVNIYFDSQDGGAYNIDIFSTRGQQVKTYHMFAVEGGNEVKLALWDLDPGMYILKIRNGSKLHKTIKFKKQ